MVWSILFWSLFLLVALRALGVHPLSLRPAGIAFWFIGVSGILLLLAGSYISTLPSRAPRKTIVGLAENRSASGLIKSHQWQFMLVEEYTDRRIPFHTEIDGPWNDQPVRITYLDDGSYLPSVVQIEILSEDQVPWWHVQRGHSGWVGTAPARRNATVLRFAGFLLFLAGTMMVGFKRALSPEAAEATSDMV
ncbi:MAG: hypothetical protein WAK26_12470 [Terracidiphilus sp.]